MVEKILHLITDNWLNYLTICAGVWLYSLTLDLRRVTKINKELVEILKNMNETLTKMQDRKGGVMK